MFYSAVKAVFAAIFGSILNRLFPPKTAADQRADDLAKTVKQEEAANAIETKVDRESDSVVDADLAKRVRPPGA